MDSTRTAEPGPTSALSQGRELIGLALQTAFPWECNFLTASLFWAALDAGLRLKGIKPTGSGGVFGPCFIVWIMPTQDRNPALRAVEEIGKELANAVISWDACELAFFDKSEGYWRTIHPYGAPPFDRFLTEEKIQAARERLAGDMRDFRRSASELRRLLRLIRGEAP